MVFCSQGCRGDWISENWTGVDHPAWMGGHDWDYGPTWPEKREKALERDGRQCVVCGKGERALGREPDVHHIIRKAAFDDLETAHELANLVTLCRGHHIQWEGIPLRPQ
jgi:5-methylcytosine-specific restriction endonuclease McrA